VYKFAKWSKLPAIYGCSGERKCREIMQRKSKMESSFLS
jgi:hypothetical protein